MKNTACFGLLLLIVLFGDPLIAKIWNGSQFQAAELESAKSPDSQKDEGEHTLSGAGSLESLGPPAEDTQTEAEEMKGLREVTLQEVVVTATRKQALVEDTPASVTIIDSKELEQSALKTVDDVLRSVAGVDIWGSNFDPLGQRAVTVRGVGGGSSQERTLILIDGVPVNDTWSGSVVWNQIAKEDVERVEVVRGPSSSLYGTNAMGGVINIITRLPSIKPFTAKLKGTYGELDTWATYGNVSGRVCDGTYGYYLSGKMAGTDGYVAFRDEIPGATKNTYDIQNLYSQAAWFLDQYSYLRFTGTYFHEEREKGFPFSNLNPGEIFRGNVTYRRDVPNGLSWLGILYGHNEEQTHENDSREHDRLDRLSKYEKPFYGVILQPSFPLAGWNVLTLGTELKFSEATQRDNYVTSTRETETRGRQQYFGVYLQDEATLFSDRLIIIPGARFDYWRSYDGSFTDSNPLGFPVDIDYDSKDWQSFNPKLGVVYHLTKATSFRGSIGTGYRAPSPVELYAQSNYGGTTLVRGNPDLEPEKVFSYEAGVVRKFSDRLDVRLTLYRSRVDDLIDTRLVEFHDPFRIMQKDNISQVIAQGVELETYYRITNELTGYFNYTFNDSTIEEDEVNPDIEGNHLAHSPQNKLNVGLTYDNPKLLTATLVGRFVDHSYDDNENTLKLNSYYTFDLYLSRSIGKHLKLTFDIENILDEEYDIPSFNLYRSSGRLWAASLTMEF